MSRAKRRSRPKGITNKQASFLAALQRQAGERYSGSGLTRQRASDEIDRLLRLKGQKPKPPPAVRVRYQRTNTPCRPKRVASPPKSGCLDLLPSEPGPTDTQLHDLAILARRVNEPVPFCVDRGTAAQELKRLKEAAQGT